ncbi:MAG: hypothetical protein AAFV07_18200, partial [Bacteroidota bacterium]
GADSTRYIVGTIRRHLGTEETLLPIGTATSWQPLWIKPVSDSLPRWVEARYHPQTLDPPENLLVEEVPVAEFLSGGYWELFGPSANDRPYDIRGEWYPDSLDYTEGDPVAGLLRSDFVWTAPDQDSFSIGQLAGGGLWWSGVSAGSWGQWALARLAYPVQVNPPLLQPDWRAWISGTRQGGRELTLEMTEPGAVYAVLYDIQGRRWWQHTWFAPAGQEQRWLNLPDTTPQLWILELQTAGGRQVIRILP